MFIIHAGPAIDARSARCPSWPSACLLVAFVNVCVQTAPEHTPWQTSLGASDPTALEPRPSGSSCPTKHLHHPHLPPVSLRLSSSLPGGGGLGRVVREYRRRPRQQSNRQGALFSPCHQQQPGPPESLVPRFRCSPPPIPRCTAPEAGLPSFLVIHQSSRGSSPTVSRQLLSQ